MTPLILLVGFLGSGKTTYLRRLLPALREIGIDPHVIINDYENAGVDAELLRELADSIIPISGSCVCCGSRDELISTLEKFAHSPGRVAVIETNGTTDSDELIEMLSIEPSLGKFTLPVQLSVIDGQRWQKRFWHNSLELAQARTAGFLFISRWEEADAKRRQKVEESLARHGLHARRMEPGEFAKEIGTVLAEVRDVADREAAAHPAKCGCGHSHGCGGDHHCNEGGSHDCCGDHHCEDHDHHHDNGEHGEEHGKPHTHAAHHFASLQIDLPETVPQRALAAFLDGLPPEVIRVKGLARLAESPEEYHVFQRVDDSATQWLPIGRTSRLSRPVAVLIGPGIEPEAIRTRAAELFRTGSV